jgi:hypothetical protein
MIASHSQCVDRVMKLLLINPRSPESFWTFRRAAQEIAPRKRAVNPPLGLATVAHGDRISIVGDRRLRDVVTINSSVFHLVFAEP